METAEDVIARDVGFFPELCFFVDSVPELHLCISSDNEEEEQGGAGVPEAEGRGDVVEEAVASVVIKTEKEEVMQDEDERPRASKPNTPLTPSNSTTSPPSSPLPVAAPVPSTARVHYAPLHCVEYYNALLRRTIALVLSKSGFVTIGSTQVPHPSPFFLSFSPSHISFFLLLSHIGYGRTHRCCKWIHAAIGTNTQDTYGRCGWAGPDGGGVFPRSLRDGSFRYNNTPSQSVM